MNQSNEEYYFTRKIEAQCNLRKMIAVVASFAQFLWFLDGGWWRIGSLIRALKKGFQSQEGGRCGDERGVCVVIFAIRLNWMETKKLICLWGWNFVHSVVWWFFFVAQIQGVSDIEGAKDIISKMLVVLPECRITIPQVLEHDWFQVWLAPSFFFVFFFFPPHKLNETPLPKLAKVGTKWAFLLFFSVMESKKANFFYSDFVVLF